jgi:hypothetical protein
MKVGESDFHEHYGLTGRRPFGLAFTLEVPTGRNFESSV